ncbi:hypothetical protein QYS49_37965 [Marivirga salinae]|uniref:Carboxypeptidase-like regulatory domain-containing protein n=1 Tax=Marivirga salinarum TaxID=3059078 RepID=A0AA51REA8_9BACT|nr:hypothetical protein [Marivirga sp. BDSF4-3]WMN11325.1 hypothetical protein QYS49_37965 [Marivirga sp. BDSF4-3]
MNRLKIILIIAFSVLSFSHLKAQKQLKGLLIDEDTNDPIEGSHIINLSKKTIAISNQNGQFSIQAQSFDTLLISNINYHRKEFILKEINPVVIYMTPLIIQLDEVEVSNRPKNSSVFSEKLKNMENQDDKGFRIYGVPQAKPMAEIPPLFQEDNSLRFWENGRILPPATIDIYVIPKMFSRKYKAKMKYYALKAEKDDRIIYNKRFNRNIVKGIVGLEGNLLTDFISFMDVEEEFIKSSTDYEIMVFIKDKYNEFMRFGE